MRRYAARRASRAAQARAPRVRKDDARGYSPAALRQAALTGSVDRTVATMSRGEIRNVARCADLRLAKVTSPSPSSRQIEDTTAISSRTSGRVMPRTLRKSRRAVIPTDRPARWRRSLASRPHLIASRYQFRSARTIQGVSNSVSGACAHRNAAPSLHRRSDAGPVVEQPCRCVVFAYEKRLSVLPHNALGLHHLQG